MGLAEPGEDDLRPAAETAGGVSQPTSPADEEDARQSAVGRSPRSGRVFLGIPVKPFDRFQMVRLGLQGAGFEVDTRDPDPNRHDAVIVWNKTETTAELRSQFRGRPVIVMENGYIKRDVTGERHYALALGSHSGAGEFYPGDASRWTKMGLSLKPWKKYGDYVTVIRQRGIGEPPVAMPAGWPTKTRQMLEDITRKPVVIRPPPASNRGVKPLADCLEESWAVVCYSSQVAVEALMAGVPVFICGPSIVADACNHDLWRIDRPDYPERQAVFQRLAWAQWSETEIVDGAPFRHLLLR